MPQLLLKRDMYPVGTKGTQRGTGSRGEGNWGGNVMIGYGNLSFPGIDAEGWPSFADFRLFPLFGCHYGAEAAPGLTRPPQVRAGR
jgi:hypothetical protein